MSLNQAEVEEHWSLLRIAREAAIELHPVKGRPGQYAANCPFHPGDRHKHLGVNAIENKFHCFVCGASGRVIEFYALVNGGISYTCAKERLREEFAEKQQTVGRFPKRKTRPRHPAEQLSTPELRALGFTGTINWYDLWKTNPAQAKRLADWIWQVKKQRDEQINRLLQEMTNQGEESS